MKKILYLIVVLLIISSCGKKSDPVYKGFTPHEKNNQKLFV